MPSGKPGSNNPGAYQGGQPGRCDEREGIQDVSAVKGAIPAEYEDAIVDRSSWYPGRAPTVHGSLFENFQNRASQCSITVYCYKPRLNFNQSAVPSAEPLRKTNLYLRGLRRPIGWHSPSLFRGCSHATSADQIGTSSARPYQLALQAFPFAESTYRAG